MFSEHIKTNRDLDIIDLEVFLPKAISKKLINNLGVTQNISVWTQIDDI